MFRRKLLVSHQTSDVWQAVDLYTQIGQIDRALQAAVEICGQDPSQQQVFQTKYLQIVRLGAEFAEEIGDFAKAAYYWEQVIQQQPQMADAWYGLALSKANLGEIAQAKNAIDRVLKIDPQHLASQRLLANFRQLSRN